MFALAEKTDVSFHGPQLRPSPLGPSSEQYENPTGAGESTANRLTLLLQANGFRIGCVPVQGRGRGRGRVSERERGRGRGRGRGSVCVCVRSSADVCKGLVFGV